jgi:flagellar secretion chaperone FliS
MQNANAYNAYKNNSVNFNSKEKLLIMLVEGAVNFAKIGRQAIVDKDIAKAHTNIIKTENIFYELMATLDVSKGGEWAVALMNVYEFIVFRLTEANIKKDLEIMNEVIPLIEYVKGTWEEAYNIAKGIKAKD